MKCLMRIATLVLISLHVEAQLCTQQAYDNCTARARRLMPAVFALFPTIQPSYLEDHCEDVYRAFDCVDDFYWHCHPTDQRQLDGIARAYEWICDEGVDEYEEYATCLQKPNLYTEGQHCNTTYHDRLGDISAMDLITHHKRKCQYMNDYLDCVQNAVDSFCGHDASVWMREFDSRLFQPEFEAFGCIFDEKGQFSWEETTTGAHHYHLHKDQSGWGVAAVLLILTIMLTAALVAVSVCLGLHRRRYARERAARQAPSEPATRYLPSGVANPGYNLNTPHDTVSTGAVASTGAGPLPNKSAFPLDEDRYPDTSSYVRFENDERPEQPYVSPQEVDITTGVGQYDLSVSREPHCDVSSSLPASEPPTCETMGTESSAAMNNSSNA